MKLLRTTLISISLSISFNALAEEQSTIYNINELEDDIYRLQSEFVTFSDLLMKDRKKQNTRSKEIDDLNEKIRIILYKQKKLEKKIEELELETK